MMSGLVARRGRVALGLLGALLALGAPLGWLAIRWAQGVSPAMEIRDSPELMLYLFVPTMVVFSLAGYVGGLQWERLSRANARLEELATRDGLTGLFNARSFWIDANRECRRSWRHKHRIQILVLDLDHFKDINDTYGHLVGDEILKAVTEAMSEVMRDDEALYRVGGEEFSALLIDLPDAEAEAVAERLRVAAGSVRVPVRVDGEDREIGVTISVGIAGRVCESNTDFQEIYRMADQALYAAKATGRDRVCRAPIDREKSEKREEEKVF